MMASEQPLRDGLKESSANSSTSRDPIVVLSYAASGSELLTRIMSTSQSLACTSGTGLLPLCHAAATTWRRIEGHGAVMSMLAAKSIRSLAGMIITVAQAEAGTSRWCETALSSPAAAATFHQLFPTATFLCLHRSLPGVLEEALRSYPWGLGDSPFWPYAAINPGNSKAAIVAYWANYTESLLEFESEYPQSCHRIKYEDLIADPHGCAVEIFARLNLDAVDLASWRDMPNSDLNPIRPQRVERNIGDPADGIAEQLRTKANELQVRLGYPSL